MLTAATRCPCRKKSETRTYERCCGPLHSGLEPAGTAEALMRSRYSAFAIGQADYLSATWHPSTRPPSIDLPADEAWVHLRILAAETRGDEATVEFIARCRRGGSTHTLHEVSRFLRDGGRWLYVDGVMRGP